jgi:hypothetical protein
MGFTREQLEAVDKEITSLKMQFIKNGNQFVGDEEKTMNALRRMRSVIKAGLEEMEENNAND